jgi:hypothetical protein
MKAKIQNLIIALAVFAVISNVTAQNTAFTYQGRITDNGTNFTGAGQFKFALVTSTNFNHQATATANPPSGGFITIINVTFVGSGYTNAPAVTITGGGGSGATATANPPSGGVVTGITVNNPGSGYTSTPTVAVAPPPPNIAYSTFWSNDGTSVAGSAPTAAVSVGVTNGLFTAVLGDTTVANMTAISTSLFTQPNLQLRIWFNDGVNGFAALSPLQNLTPAPYANFANSAGIAASATNATTATSATTANNFSGSLSGDVTGTQGATVVAKVGGQSAANVAGAVSTVYSATSADTANSIVQRDANGSFIAGSIALANNLNLPTTTASSGIINSGGSPFIHDYGIRNVFAGVASGNLTTSGIDNAGFGYYVLNGITSGQHNVGVGSQALGYNTSGNGNVGVGFVALGSNTGGSANVAIGFDALANLTSGQNNVALGMNAGVGITTGDNNIYIGNNGSDGDSDVIRIGTPGTHQSASIAGIYNHATTGVPVYVVSSGQLGTLTSSAKFKQHIESMGDASDVLLALKPVTYQYKPEIDPEGIPQFGLVAEDVEKVNPDLVVHDAEHGIYTVRYQAVDAMLLNEFLKEHRKVAAQDALIQDLQQNLAELKKTVQSLAEKK